MVVRIDQLFREKAQHMHVFLIVYFVLCQCSPILFDAIFYILIYKSQIKTEISGDGIHTTPSSHEPIVEESTKNKLAKI